MTMTTATPTLAVVWYRSHDLRTDDHDPLRAARSAAAASAAGRLVPVVALDEKREMLPSRTGPHRLRFRLECLHDLAEQLEGMGSGLVIRPGAPEEVLPAVLAEVAAAEAATAMSARLFFHRAVPAPPLDDDDDRDDDDQEQLEREVAAAFVAAAKALGFAAPAVHRCWGSATLHHPWRELPGWVAAAPAGGGRGGGAAAAKAAEGGEEKEEEEDDQSIRPFLTDQLPASFSAYRRALEAGSAPPSTAATTAATTKETKNRGPAAAGASPRPPLRTRLPFTAPLPPPPAPLPPLPGGVRRGPPLPGDVFEAYERAGGGQALAALSALERLVSSSSSSSSKDGDGGGGALSFARRGAVIPAYACPEGHTVVVAEDGWRHPRADPRSGFPYVGGERAARARLAHVAGRLTARGGGSADASALLPYGEARMMAAGDSAWSAKLSPYLSAGCVSPRRVAAEVLLPLPPREEGEEEEDDDDGALWLLTHLVIRDWYILSGWRYRLASSSRQRQPAAPLPPRAPSTASSTSPFEAWARGQTGRSAFVDAAMRELACTGWQSNRARQLAASLLVHEQLLLSSTRGGGGEEGGGGGSETEGWPVGWQRGARLFECLLIDGDHSANRGNWRQARRFDTAAQAAKYDPDGRQAREWLR
jgi:deoxyribodipyrimidine photolyase